MTCDYACWTSILPINSGDSWVIQFDSIEILLCFQHNSEHHRFSYSLSCLKPMSGTLNKCKLIKLSSYPLVVLFVFHSRLFSWRACVLVSESFLSLRCLFMILSSKYEQWVNRTREKAFNVWMSKIYLFVCF